MSTKMPAISGMPYRQGANAIVLNSYGEVFIVQKSNYKDNEWDLPGGGLEDDETPAIGVLRELEEELGTKDFEVLAQSKYINKFEWPLDVIERGFSKRNKWYRGQEKYQFLVKFNGNKNDIKLQEEEIKKAKWVKPSELESHFVFPGQAENARNLIKEFSL